MSFLVYKHLESQPILQFYEKIIQTIIQKIQTKSLFLSTSDN